MTKPNRWSFVLFVALVLLGAFPASGLHAAGWPQQVAMWHPQQWQWPGQGAPSPEGYWGGHGQQAAPPQSQGADKAQERGRGAGKQRSAAKARPAISGSGREARAAKSKILRTRGVASWYGKRFHGRKTASGQRYDMHAMTAAHRTLPLPSYVRVTNPSNGSSVVVLVNDRGPYVGKRIIDLSYAAATALGIVKRGTAIVELEPIAHVPPTLASAESATASEAPAQPPGLTVTAVD